MERLLLAEILTPAYGAGTQALGLDDFECS